MAKKNHAKKALISSLLALFICFTMLIGTTFAWFTDSAASGSNVITAGNLDIEVQYTLDGTNWSDLDGAADLFQKGLWEPGHTEVVVLKIENKGSLALKYAANMNIVNETVGKTKDGADIVLSDILTVSTLVQQAVDADGSANQVGDITLGLAFEGENRVGYENTETFKAGNVLRADQYLEPGEAHYLIVKVDMAETVGNEANHNGTDIPTINFGINVLAAQYTSESDSFDNQYDKDAVYDGQPPVDAVEVASADELISALANGKSVVLKEEIVIPDNTSLTLAGTTMFFAEENYDVKFGNGVILEGSGKIELSGVDIVLSENLVVNGDIVISGHGAESLVWDQLSLVKGTGSLTLKDVNTYNDDEFYVEVSNLIYDGGDHTYGALLLQESPVVTFKDGYMTFESTKGWHTYAPDIIIGGNATLNIEGGEIVYDYNGDQAMTLGGYYYIPVENVTVNITGGKIDAGPECLISVEKGENTASNTKVNISGGTFILNNGRVLQDFSSWGDAENYGAGMLTLTGGTFFTSNSSRLDSFVTDGYKLDGDAANGYVVTAE